MAAGVVDELADLAARELAGGDEDLADAVALGELAGLVERAEHRHAADARAQPAADRRR